MQPWKTLAVRVCAILLSVSTAAAAQSTTSSGTQPGASPDDVLARALADAKENEARSAKRQAQRDPLVRSGLTLPEPQVSFETTKGNGRASGTIGFVQQQARGETSILVAVSGPIASSPDAEAHPIDLRGPTNGASVSAGFNSASMFKTFSVEDIKAICKDIPKEDCTAGKLEENHPELSKRLLDTVFQAVPILYGATVTYGRNKFSFVDSTGAKQPAAPRNDFEVEGSIGLLVNKRTNLLAFHVTYSDTHSASPDKTQLCRPLTGSTVTRCDTAVIGAPVEDKSAITTIEYRWQLPGEQKVPIAVAPKFQYAFGIDGAEDLKSFEVPVYFFQEKADPKATSTAPKLNGGISAGWRSDDGFHAYVFIGTTFKLFTRE
jgi:hypothetical protein